MNKVVNLTQRNINEGKLVDVRYCPIALALWDLEFDEVYVLEEYIQIKNNGKRYKYLNNTDIKSIIQDFDDEKSILPCTLNLEFTEI